MGAARKEDKKRPGKLPKKESVSWFTKTWAVLLVLGAITFLVYARTLTLGFTKLDDTIFIVENAPYNEEWSNLLVSFQRGLFNPVRDAYYRPLFLVNFIVESKLFGTEPAGYHFTNLLFHIGSVLLLFLFLKRLRIPPANAFLLSLLFSVLPVLTQAVAWIPGRNDMILMILFLGAFILFLKYLDKPSPLLAGSHFLLMVAALFTKETAIIIPVILAATALFYLKSGWKKLAVPAVLWVASLGVWLYVRSTATLSGDWVSLSSMLKAGAERLGVILQYLGKIFLPVNLAVFPEARDISLWWGVLALVLLIALVVYSGSYRKPLTYVGIFWFLVFLLPVLLVPKSLNDQVFEHRLYLPVVGILLILSQCEPFSGKIPLPVRIYLVAGISVVFAGISIYRTGYFSDPVTFWTKAVEGSPRSVYARTLLGTKLEDPVQQERLFREARQLDPTHKNLNYYLGKVLFEKNQPDSAEKYLRDELSRNPVADAYFLLARIDFEKQRFDSAAVHLREVIRLNPFDPQANHNLALLYHERGNPEKAKEVVRQMQERGMAVDNDLLLTVMKNP